MTVNRKEKYNQVCVWPATVVGEDQVEDFEQFMYDEFEVRVQYLEEIETFQDIDEYGNTIEYTEGRNDLFFAVHSEDLGKFAIQKLRMGIRWIEDVLDPGNYISPIYPDYVYDYQYIHAKPSY